jgi:transcriptional regulator with XRE-family HTH domain
MSLAQKRVSFKDKYPTVIRLRPIYNEGRYIRSLAVLKGLSLKKITDILGVSRTSIHCVIYGKRRSARIESEIAKILGHSSWNDVVLEARSAVQGKPVNVIVREMEQKQGKNDLAKSIKDNAHDAIFSRDWSAHLKAYAEEQAAAKNKKVKTRRGA